MLVACVNKVDLPMPGSPPTRSTEPRTKPPPVTRSSSVMPEDRRGASLLFPVSDSSANVRPRRFERLDTANRSWRLGGEKREIGVRTAGLRARLSYQVVTGYHGAAKLAGK